jgi:quinol monooxygenase YgiN
MVHVALTLVARPRRVIEMLSALQSLMLPLRAAQGFVDCRLFRAVDDGNTIRYIEEWATPEDLDRQIRSSHYTRLLSIMEEAAEQPEFRMSWVEAVKGLEYLESVRQGDS